MTETQELVRRLLDAPDITRVVPRLPAEVLHRVIERCGLEACADVVTLATARQLERILDIDLWRAPAPGADESLDTERFGLWLEVILEAGEDAAADTLARMDLGLVTDGLAAHVAVFDGAAVAPYTTIDGEQIPGRLTGDRPVAPIGGFVVESRRPSAWHAVVELLTTLHAVRPAFFSRLMRGCVAMSDGAREPSGFHNLLGDRDQHRADLAAEREARRDRQGYVTPAQARAFLQAARGIDLDGGQPAIDPIAHACLRDVVPEPLVEDEAVVADGGPAPEASTTADAQAVVDVMAILSDAGVLTPPRALLGAGASDDGRLALVRACAEAHVTAPQELAFLTNALLSGCGIQDRRFTQQEAADAVAATCNLGLERWPDTWPARDLVTAFEVGWALLHRDLCRHAASAAIDVLANLECSERAVSWDLQTLRRELIRHLGDGEPWRARHALDAILMLDASAWAVLRALLDECPTMHAVLASPERARLKIDPAEFTFVARTSEIAVVRDYLATLASRLTE